MRLFKAKMNADCQSTWLSPSFSLVDHKAIEIIMSFNLYYILENSVFRVQPSLKMPTL